MFGSRGAGNFLSKSTKWLAIAFFAISLFMGWNTTHGLRNKPAATTAAPDLGLMSAVPSAPATTKAPAVGPAVPVAPQVQQQAPAVPVAPPASSTAQQTPQTPSQGG